MSTVTQCMTRTAGVRASANGGDNEGQGEQTCLPSALQQVSKTWKHAEEGKSREVRWWPRLRAEDGGWAGGLWELSHHSHEL